MWLQRGVRMHIKHLVGTQEMEATVITNGRSSHSASLVKSLLPLQTEPCVGSYLM